jgi:hypothetical protein
MLADLFGGETEDWIGKVIQLYADKTRFGHKVVPCVRVRRRRVNNSMTKSTFETEPPRRGRQPDRGQVPRRNACLKQNRLYN